MGVEEVDLSRSCLPALMVIICACTRTLFVGNNVLVMSTERPLRIRKIETVETKASLSADKTICRLVREMIQRNGL